MIKKAWFEKKICESMDVEECCNAEKLGLKIRVTVGNQLKME